MTPAGLRGRVEARWPPPRLPEAAQRCWRRVRDELGDCPIHGANRAPHVLTCEHCAARSSLDTAMAMLHAALYAPRDGLADRVRAAPDLALALADAWEALETFDPLKRDAVLAKLEGLGE